MSDRRPEFPFLIPDVPAPTEWIEIYQDAYSSGIFSNFGPLSRRLEAALAGKYAAAGYQAVACSSATLGLVAALMARFQPGSRIALPNFTFAATYQAIRMAGLVPVPVDIEADTMEIALASLREAANTTKIAGVVPVRPFGFVRDRGDLVAFCRERGMGVVFDSAACLGGQELPPFGSEMGEIEVFSLHATKSFGIGEGGVILCPASQADGIRKTLNFGFHQDRTYDVGINGKLDELHAAVALAQFRRIDEIQRSRAAHVAQYDAFFENIEGASTPTAVAAGSGWTMYPVVFENDSVERIGAAALALGLETRRYYWPTVTTGARGGVDSVVSVDVSEHVADHILCFPVYGGRAAEKVGGVFHALRQIFP